MTFPEFLAKWTNPAGQRINYDDAFGYQCVDLIEAYAAECEGIASGVHGNAIDYWNRPAPVLLTKFHRVSTQTPEAGDIVVLTSPITVKGHIGIATGAISGATFQMLEQNGSAGTGTGRGSDAIRTRYLTRTRIVGVLRPTVAPALAPPATPMITLAQLTQLYNQILRRAPDAGGIAHYVGHYSYNFVETDLLNSAEHKQIQANDAAAAAQVAQAAADAAKAVQMATMQPAVQVLPAVVPTSTVKYPIKTTVKTYGSVTDAQNGTNSKGEILAGATWYIFCEKSGVLNITQTPGITSGTWINPADNVTPPLPVPEPTPEPVAAPVEQPKTETAEDILNSLIPIVPDGSPISCKVLSNVMVVDTWGRMAPFTIYAGGNVQVYGTFSAGGHWFALVKFKNKAIQGNYMLGITITSRDNFAPYLDDIYKMSDHVKMAWELIYDKGAQSIDGVFRAIKNKISKI